MKLDPTKTGTSIPATLRVGKNPQIDQDVILGYRSPRQLKDSTLVVGDNPTIRNGPVIYEGTSIGNDLQTGHNVVIREENIIGDGLCIWSNSIVDYGCRIGNKVKIHSNVSPAFFRASDRYAPSSRFSRTFILEKSRRPSGTWANPRFTISNG